MFSIEHIGLGLEANYDQFYMAKGIRTTQGLTAPRFSKLDTFVFPRNSLLHYLPETESELGLTPTHFMLRQAPSMVMTYPVEDLVEKEGSPIRTVEQIGLLKIKYQKQYRRFRPVQNLVSADKQEQALLIINFSLLQHLYRYRPNWRTRIFKFDNLYKTLIAQINTLAELSPRAQFLELRLPDVLPLRAQFVRGQKGLDKITMNFFKDDASLLLLQLWLWLGTEREQSIFNQLSPNAIERINFVIAEGGHYTVLRLSLLNDWRKDPALKGDKGLDPLQLQLRFIKFLEIAKSLGTVVDQDNAVVATDPESGEEIVGVTLNEKEEIAQMLAGADEELVEETQLIPMPSDYAEPNDLLDPRKDSDVTAYSDGVVKVSESLMEIGLVSAAEHRRMHALAESYLKIPNPRGQGTLADLLKIDNATTKNLNVKRIKDNPFVIDKSMLSSSLVNFDGDYVEKLMHKDIANMLMQAQNVGVAITDYRIEEVKDAANGYEIHSVQLTPVAGRASTFRFKIPTIDKSGVFIANSVKCRLRKQRGDLPIRKVSPTRVALTTYYGKVFVVRSGKKVNDYANWLHSQVALAIEEGKVTSPKYGKVFNHELPQPRVFSLLATRYTSFDLGGLDFQFDVNVIENLVGSKEYQSALLRNEMPCVFKNGKLYATITSAGDLAIEGTTVLTSVEELLSLDRHKAPVELVDLKFMGKDVPVGFILAYYLTLSGLLRMLKVSYRTVGRGSRMDLQEDEYVIRFADQSLILPREHRLAALLIGGFESYHKAIANYQMESFDSKDVYGAALDRAGLGARYLREIDLMKNLFVDHFAKEILEEMNEPTTFEGLLYRATELLLNDTHPKEIDGAYRRERGYERIPGHVYAQLVKGLRQYKAKPVTTKTQVDISPNAVWQEIQSDSSLSIIEESNPVQNLKEKENTTFSGTGGRSERSMVRATRGFHKNDLGVISEATVDNGTVGVTAYMTANPQLKSLRGLHAEHTFNPEDPTSILSTSALLSPGATNDGMNRANFINIQLSHVVAAKGYQAIPLRTGYESVIAHRTDPLFSVTSKGKGKVTGLTETVLTIVYDDPSFGEDRILVGRTYGVVTGTTVPHDIVTDLKVGDRVDIDDVVAWNTGFYERDLLVPRQVVWKAGILIRLALMDVPTTYEDSSIVSKDLTSKMEMNTTETRMLTLGFKQEIRNLITVGQTLSADDILCNIVDEIEGQSLFDEQTTASLNLLSRNSPRAKYDGVVGRIEVLYRGDLEDASKTLQELIKRQDKVRAKELGDLGKQPLTGEIEDLELDTVQIKIFIDSSNLAADGDKGVFGNQCKSIIGEVMDGVNETLDGQPIDAIYSYTGVSNRIIYSPFIIGTTIPLLRIISKRALRAGRGERV